MRLLVQGCAGHPPIVAAGVRPHGSSLGFFFAATSSTQPHSRTNTAISSQPDAEQEPLALQWQVRLERGHVPELVDQRHRQDQRDLVPEVDRHRARVEDRDDPVRAPEAGEPGEVDTEVRLGPHQQRHEAGRPEGLRERVVVEVVRAVARPGARRRTSRRSRCAARESTTTTAGFSRCSTPSRCAKPSIQQNRYVDRSHRALPKRLSGPAHSEVQDQDRREGQQQDGDRREPEDAGAGAGRAGRTRGTSAGTRGSPRPARPRRCPADRRAARSSRRSASPASSRGSASPGPRTRPRTRTGAAAGASGS